jgi:hypothetical protein
MSPPRNPDVLVKMIGISRNHNNFVNQKRSTRSVPADEIGMIDRPVAVEE